MHRLHVPVPFVNEKAYSGNSECASVDRVDYSSNKMPNASLRYGNKKVFFKEPRQDIVLEYILIKIFIPSTIPHSTSVLSRRFNRLKQAQASIYFVYHYTQIENSFGLRHASLLGRKGSSYFTTLCFHYDQTTEKEDYQ